MPRRQEIRSYDYVNHPYERVRDALADDPAAVFSAATQAAASRAHSVAAELRVNLVGIEVGAEISVSVGTVTHGQRDEFSGPVTHIPVYWEAAKRPRLFPLMSAELSIYPLTPTETQLDFDGLYEPPLGSLGGAVDAVIGHRLAQASVHRFVADVAAHLRDSLASEPDRRGKSG